MNVAAPQQDSACKTSILEFARPESARPLLVISTVSAEFVHWLMSAAAVSAEPGPGQERCVRPDPRDSNFQTQGVMRYELADYEWVATKPMLPNKQRGVPRVNDPRPQWHFPGLASVWPIRATTVSPLGGGRCQGRYGRACRCLWCRYHS